MRFDGDVSGEYKKIVKIEHTHKGVKGGDTTWTSVLTLNDGGLLTVKYASRANSGGSTYDNNYFVSDGKFLYNRNGGTTSTTGSTWTVYWYKFVGNNGADVTSGQYVFTYSSVKSTPSSFSPSISKTISWDDILYLAERYSPYFA